MGCYLYTIISFANNGNLTSSSPNFIPFLSFGCLIDLARISGTILSSYGESRQSYLVINFSGICLSFSLFNFMLTVGMLYIAFIMLDISLVCLISQRPVS